MSTFHTHTHTHTHIIYINIYIYIYTHTHTDIVRDIHMNPHTYTHMHIYIYIYIKQELSVCCHTQMTSEFATNNLTTNGVLILGQGQLMAHPEVLEMVFLS